MLEKDAEITGVFDDAAIRELCGNRTWREGLIFSTDTLEGSVAEVRNTILTTLRYAVESGGMCPFSSPSHTQKANPLNSGAYVLPQIHPPPIIAPYPPKKKPRTLPISTYFDAPHLVSSLSSACPNLTIYSSLNDLWDRPTINPPHPLSPPSLAPLNPADLVIHHPESWNSSLTQHLEEIAPKGFSKEKPVMIRITDGSEVNGPNGEGVVGAGDGTGVGMGGMCEWPTQYDGPEVRKNWGRLLRSRDDVRRLAASVVYKLVEQLGMYCTWGMDGICFVDQNSACHHRADPAKNAKREYMSVLLTPVKPDWPVPKPRAARAVRAESWEDGRWKATDAKKKAAEEERLRKEEEEKMRMEGKDDLYTNGFDAEESSKESMKMVTAGEAQREDDILLAHAKKRNLTTVYAAVAWSVGSSMENDAETIRKFREEAREKYNVTVVTKYDLLSKQEVEELEKLEREGMGELGRVGGIGELVDMEVLLRSRSFAGMERSWDAWGVVMRRHASGRGHGDRWDAELEWGLQDGTTVADWWSSLYGAKLAGAGRRGCKEGMWP